MLKKGAPNDKLGFLPIFELWNDLALKVESIPRGLSNFSFSILPNLF